MKLGTKLSFGVNAVQAGQKTAIVNATPQLVVSSTLGKFTVTSPVSKALNVAVGENIMFLNNISGVEDAIQRRVEDVVAYAEENGLDLNTREGADAVLDAFTQWFIAKGVPQYDAKGNPIMVAERLTKEDKAKYLAAHAMEIIEANRELLAEKFGERADEDYVEVLTIDMIESPKYHSCSGSRTATSSNATGVGCQLNFTDTSIWNTLKANLGDNKTKKNRVFDVVLDEAQEVPYNNGREEVGILIYPINFVKDVDPVVRGKAEETAE